MNYGNEIARPTTDTFVAYVKNNFLVTLMLTK